MKNISTLSVAAALLGSVLSVNAGQVALSKQVVPVAIESTDIAVHPITAPYWAEDSSITTDLRPVFAYHAFPGDLLGGGRATVTAMQLRIALTKSLQLVAYKDGWLDIDTKGLKKGGWNDLAAGLKWAFLQNDRIQLHAAVGAGYEFASGDDNVLQDDDEVRLWASVDKGFGKLHLGATFNYFFSGGNGKSPLGDSDHLSWHLHADYQLTDWLSPVLEVNGYHVISEGSPVTSFQGDDVLNLGGNSSEPTVTVGLGVEVRPFKTPVSILKGVAFRAAYELPVTDSSDLFGHRWTFSAVITF